MKFLLINMLFFTFFKTDHSLKCYKCLDDENCQGNPTVCSSPIGNPYCLKVKEEKNGQRVTLKQCSYSTNSLKSSCESTSYEQAEGTICWCTSDLCNNADRKIKCYFITLILIFISFSVQFV